MSVAGIYTVVLVECGCISLVETFDDFDKAETFFGKLKQDYNRNDDDLHIYDWVGCRIDLDTD